MMTRFNWMILITLAFVAIVLACLVFGEVFMFLVSDDAKVTRGVIFLTLGLIFVNEIIETFKHDRRNFQEDTIPAPAGIPEYQLRQYQNKNALERSLEGRPHYWQPIHPKLAHLSRNEQKAIRLQAKKIAKAKRKLNKAK